MTVIADLDWRLVALRLYNALTTGPTYPMKFDIHELRSWHTHVRQPALEQYEQTRDEWFDGLADVQPDDFGPPAEEGHDG